MNPAVPSPPNDGGLRQTFVDHPPPLEAERRVDSASFRAGVTIAVLVLDHKFAVSPGPHQRTEGRAIPRGKKTKQEFLHSHESNAPCRSWRMARCRRSPVDAIGADLSP